MSRMMHIDIYFIRRHCRHRLLMHIWFNKCVILLNRQNSRKIPWLCRSHKRMQNYVKPLHVIWRTLIRHYTNLPYMCNIVTELYPSSIHLFNRSQRRIECGGMVWIYPNCRTTLSGQWMTVKGPHLRWQENKEMTSNSLNERCSPNHKIMEDIHGE